jgi:hypothetical protein
LEVASPTIVVMSVMVPFIFDVSFASAIVAVSDWVVGVVVDMSCDCRRGVRGGGGNPGNGFE